MFSFNKELLKQIFAWTVIALFLGTGISMVGRGSQQSVVKSPEPTISIDSAAPSLTVSPDATLLPTVSPESQKQTPKPSSSKSSDVYYKVTEVIDGDTIKVSINGEVKTLRLIGLNTPETVDPRKPVECFGKEASAKAKELLLGKSVMLEPDPTQGELDKYQRLLRYVFLQDGTSYNKWMIQNGYAYEYTYNLPYKYQAEYKAAEKYARDNQKGLWAQSTCQTPSPQITPSIQPSSTGHIFYLSTHWSAKYYYCDTDEQWKSLSPTYLRSFNSEAELLKAYPTQILHLPCE